VSNKYIEGANYLGKREVSLMPRRLLCPDFYGRKFDKPLRGDQDFSKNYFSLVNPTAPCKIHVLKFMHIS
jgi:hypothetical protein